MNNSSIIKYFSLLALLKGAVLLFLGFAHIIATFFEYHKISNQMSSELVFQYLLWYSSLGLYNLFVGFVDIMTANGIKQKAFWAWRFSLISAIFTTLTGISSVIFLNFTIGPQYILLAIGLLYLFIVCLSKKHFI